MKRLVFKATVNKTTRSCNVFVLVVSSLLYGADVINHFAEQVRDKKTFQTKD